MPSTCSCLPMHRARRLGSDFLSQAFSFLSTYKTLWDPRPLLRGMVQQHERRVLRVLCHIT